MLALISPAKKLDFESKKPLSTLSQPDFLDKATILVKAAKTLNKKDLARTMKISEKLAELNVKRFKDFSTPFNLTNAKQAAFMFKGDTYVGLDIESLSEKELQFAQSHLRILSGLYGILRPLDLIQPYRLEMGARFQPPKKTNLYDFWTPQLTDAINAELSQHDNKTIINLASNEYSKVIQFKKIQGTVINPIFKEIKNGKTRTLGMYAKRARGMMARFIIKQSLKAPDELKMFNQNGYIYNKNISDSNNWLFTRQQP